MRLMTIFQLAAKTEAELQSIHRKAAENAANSKLNRSARQQAMGTFANIARVRSAAPKP